MRMGYGHGHGRLGQIRTTATANTLKLSVAPILLITKFPAANMTNQEQVFATGAAKIDSIIFR